MTAANAFLSRVSLLALPLVLLASYASAHRLNESYVYFNVTDESLKGRFEASLSDLDKMLGLDSDGDGTVSDVEFMAQSASVFEFLAERLQLTSNGSEVALAPGPTKILDAGFARFAQIGFEFPELEFVPESMEMSYLPLNFEGPGQLGLAIIESNTRVGLEGNEAYVSLSFDGSGGFQTLSLVGEPWFSVFVKFIEHGIWHIWLGFDHVLFLITLLLPSAMAVMVNRWVPTESFASGLWNVTKIVTTFTISHSVTLTLAAFGVLQLPVALVEAVIAFSIIAVAIMNLFPQVHRHMLWIVFIFGLFHGFGFANVLAPLALDPTRVAVGVAAFNIGVEIGQLAIVVVAFPIIWLLRRWRFYPPLAFKAGTAAIVLVAGIWSLERTTSFEWNTRATIEALTGIAV